MVGVSECKCMYDKNSHDSYDDDNDDFHDYISVIYSYRLWLGRYCMFDILYIPYLIILS